MTQPARETESGPWRIAVVQDHPLQRLRTEEVLGAEPGFDLVHSCDTLPELVDWLDRYDGDARPHLVVLDVGADGGANADADSVRAIVRTGIRVLALTATAYPPTIRDVLRAGAAGVVGTHDPERDVAAAARAVLDDRPWLTAEVAAAIAGDDDRPALGEHDERALLLFASGLALDEVATTIGVSRDEVEVQLHRVIASYARTDP